MNTVSTHIARFARSGSGAVTLASRNGEPLPLSLIRERAPSVFAEGKHDSRSERYSYIPTSEVLAGLMKEGFQPFAVMQGGSRDEQKRGFTKHLIRMRHASSTLQVGGTHNEVILLNSHDGTSSYRLMGGVFRLVCGNGLVVAEGDLADVRIPHTGDVTSRVIDGCIEVLERLPEVSDTIGRWNGLQLSDGEREAFAAAAAELRWTDGEPPVETNRLLTLQRRDDAPPSLWNTLNTVQENTIRGGLRYIQRNQAGQVVARRETRPVQSVDGNTALNRALWTLARKMEELKA